MRLRLIFEKEKQKVKVIEDGILEEELDADSLKSQLLIRFLQYYRRKKKSFIVPYDDYMSFKMMYISFIYLPYFRHIYRADDEVKMLLDKIANSSKTPMEFLQNVKLSIETIAALRILNFLDMPT